MAMGLYKTVEDEMKIFQRRYRNRLYGARQKGIPKSRYEGAADELRWAYYQIFGRDIEKDIKDREEKE